MTIKPYHLYQKSRGKTFRYVDNVTRSYISMGGALIHIYPLIGVVDSKGNVTDINNTEFVVGDAVLNENYGRKYSHTTYDMYAVTTLNPPNFSWNYSGISIIDGNVVEFVLSYTDMIEILGRKIIVGDVIEVTYERDCDVLGADKGRNKFYQVTESVRDDNGWSPDYSYHLWRMKCKPILNSPEFSDLFQDAEPTGGEDGFYEPTGSINGGGGLDKGATQDDNLNDIVDETLKEAEGEDGSPENGWIATGVSYRLFDAHHFLLKENDKYYIGERPNIVGDDGIAAETTCEEIPFGESFPKNMEEGKYFLRTDYDPPKLYKRVFDKTTEQVINIVYDGKTITNAILNPIGKGFNGSIKLKDKIIGSIDKDKVYIEGSYIGYVTDSGKIVNNNGLIIGEISTNEIIVRRGFKLIENDWREKWTGVPSVLRNTINNENSFVNGEGRTIKMQSSVRELLPARIKKEHNNPRPWNKEIQQEIFEKTGDLYDIIGIKKP